MGICILFGCILDLLCRQYCCKREDSDNDEEIVYERLSEERKLDLDNLRSIAILHKLSRYTLTVSVENILKLQSDSDTMTSSTNSDETSSTDGNDSKRKGNREQSNNDIEKGVVDGNTTYAGSKEDDYSVDGNDDSECTHVMLPLPGHAITVSDDVVMPDDDCSIENEKKTIRNFVLHKLSLLTARVGKTYNNGVEKAPCTSDEPCSNDPDDEVVIENENRAVPMFCAVCLSKFTLADRVCWSSNTECTHVFHEECMLPWLVTLGRNMSKKKCYSNNPSEAKLLDFDLSCPCCRQEFISSSLIVRKEETIEELDERV
jgi:hypothetical protein